MAFCGRSFRFLGPQPCCQFIPHQAKRRYELIVRAIKGSAAPLALLPGFFLNDLSGQVAPEAESVLRHAAALPLAEM